MQFPSFMALEAFQCPPEIPVKMKLKRKDVGLTDLSLVLVSGAIYP